MVEFSSETIWVLGFSLLGGSVLRISPVPYDWSVSMFFILVTKFWEIIHVYLALCLFKESHTFWTLILGVFFVVFLFEIFPGIFLLLQRFFCLTMSLVKTLFNLVNSSFLIFQLTFSSKSQFLRKTLHLCHVWIFFIHAVASCVE